MPISFDVNDSDLVCEGSGMDFLRLKAGLSEFLGNEQIKTVGPRSFSLPLASASLAAPVFSETCGSVPEELRNETASYADHAAARDEAMKTVSERRILPLESPWADLLDPVQAVAVSAMITPMLSGLCLFDEQGIGKTLTAVAAFDVLRQRGEIDALIVVCPVTMKQAWKDEIQRFLPGKYDISIIEGLPDEKRRIALEPFDVLVTNFESIGSLLVLLKAVAGTKKIALVVDESFNIKNKDAVKSSAIRDLRKFCVKGFVLCGTPAPNSSVDVIHQYDIADNGYTFVGFVPPKDEGERTKAINLRIEERGTTVRRLKEQVLPDLPEKRFNIVSVRMTGRQESLYEVARRKLELNLKSMDNATFRKSLAAYFQQRSVLLQICACPESVDPSYSDVSAKLEKLDELVNRVVEKEGKKLIIWSFYRASLRSLMERYQRLTPVLLDGSVAAKQRAESVRRFQNDPDVRICIANPAAAGAGVTLHSASDAAYISFSNQAAHFLQSIDRIHRRGQKASSANYYFFICKDTIEENEMRRLREKELRQHELLGDNVKWPNSLDDALSELSRNDE